MNSEHPDTGLLASRWAYVPWLLLGALLCVQAALYVLSNSDPGFAVEPDYYRKAVNWDSAQAQSRKSRELGYRAALILSPIKEQSPFGDLTLTLTDAAGAPVVQQEVRVTAFHNGRSADRQELLLSEVAPGTYSAPFRLTRAGLWQFRTSAARGDQLFTQTLQQELFYLR